VQAEYEAFDEVARGDGAINMKDFLRWLLKKSL
jgi:hypothetical protein